jgi:hypothetical protein
MNKKMFILKDYFRLLILLLFILIICKSMNAEYVNYDSVEISIKPDSLDKYDTTYFIDMEITNNRCDTILTVIDPLLIEFLNDKSFYFWPTYSYYCPNKITFCNINPYELPWLHGAYLIRFTNFSRTLIIGCKEKKIIRIFLYDNYKDFLINKNWVVRGFITFAKKKDVDLLVYYFINDYVGNYKKSLVYDDTSYVFCSTLDSISQKFSREDDIIYKNLNAFDVIYKIFKYRVAYKLKN